MSTTKSPVVFIHGLWLHASAWQPWMDLFETKGYAASAPGWPGESATVAESRLREADVAGFGIEEVTQHYRTLLDTFAEKPILIGHSFGGMIVEKLLGEDYGVAGIGIDAAQIKGVLPLPLSSLRSTLPVFKNPANKEKAVALTSKEFHYAFGNALTEDESDALFEKWTIPSPGKPLFEAASANFSAHSPSQVNTGNEGRGPLLLVMGGKDHTVPEAITKATVKQYRKSSAETDLIEFPDRGHSLVIDAGWREVAESCLAWLNDHNL